LLQCDYGGVVGCSRRRGRKRRERYDGRKQRVY